jgi:predicted metallo-beta-lactamase superfamily hydrolase
MKKAIVFTSSCLILLLAVFTSCNSQTSNTAEDQSAVQSAAQSDNIVTVYYYHGERRCATCKAVGSVSEETVKDVYGDNPNVVFKDINIEEAKNNELKDKFELSGSGLFVYNGKEKVDLTAFAFQKAVSSPKELTEKIILTVSEML